MKKSTVTTAILLSALVLPMVASANSCCGGADPSSECAVTVAADAEKDQAKVVAQTMCPVMGGKINKKQYVDHDGKRIYVCCPGCIAKIKKAPAKFIKKLEDEGITLDRTPPSEKSKEKKDAHTGHKH